MKNQNRSITVRQVNSRRNWQLWPKLALILVLSHIAIDAFAAAPPVRLSAESQMKLSAVIHTFIPGTATRRKDLEEWTQVSDKEAITSIVSVKNNIYLVYRELSETKVKQEIHFQHASKSDVEAFLNQIETEMKKEVRRFHSIGTEETLKVIREIRETIIPQLYDVSTSPEPNEFNNGNPSANAPRGWYFKRTCNRVLSGLKEVFFYPGD